MHWNAQQWFFTRTHEVIHRQHCIEDTAAEYTEDDKDTEDAKDEDAKDTAQQSKRRGG